MPAYLKALGFILVLAVLVFVFAKGPMCAGAMQPRDFARRRNLWFALTLVAFLAHNFWLYIVVISGLLYVAQRWEGTGERRLALFFFLALALPAISGQISGLGVVNALFEIHYVRVLEIVVLFPAFLYLRKQPGTLPFGRTLPDKLIGAYLVLDLLLMFEHRTFTSILREGLFYAFIDVFLPYYVASRALTRLEHFREALASFAIAAMVLSAILFLELLGRWLLYSSLEHALGVQWGWSPYVIRSGLVRASGPMGHALAAGFTMSVAFACYLYLRKVLPPRGWLLGLGLILLGLLGPVSRGPWVGAVLILFVFIATGPAPAVAFGRLAALGVLGLPVLFTPLGSVIIDHLPFIGSVDESNVTGRQALAAAAYKVFWEHPLLGTYDFVETPVMQALKGGDGQVDLVNTYVVVALGRGAIGLVLFAGFFLATIAATYKAMRRVTDRSREEHVLGQALFAALLGILLMIATMSPVLLIPTIYWAVAGLAVAYVRMVTAAAPASAASRVAPTRPAAARAGWRDARAGS
ncbi:MAG TPA: hypothetical protein VG873_01320 [Burkholderiales bacterium]|nr:hypothetical protein [Burkholderiales bacterium]